MALITETSEASEKEAEEVHHSGEETKNGLHRRGGAAGHTEILFLSVDRWAQPKPNEKKEHLVVDEVQHESVAEKENEVPFFGALFQSASKSTESKKDLLVDESVAVEENEVPFFGALFQSATKSTESKKDLLLMSLLQRRRMKCHSLVLCFRAQPSC
ncbi:uncharacterized protein [Triticum aestivum]|uniref:uncharacterized protein n=1 Tax=Triticum aestivum TaxID=4565 RepID=UPI001D02879F|nr:uncharacterized protein LOC123046660 [Triticum aestivum]